eukprot:197332-Prorocentrum_lima.AAC.1
MGWRGEDGCWGESGCGGCTRRRARQAGLCSSGSKHPGVLRPVCLIMSSRNDSSDWAWECGACTRWNWP